MSADTQASNYYEKHMKAHHIKGHERKLSKQGP